MTAAMCSSAPRRKCLCVSASQHHLLRRRQMCLLSAVAAAVAQSVTNEKTPGKKLKFYLASVRGHDEERLDVMFLQEGVSLMSEARLHLVVSVQTLQGRPCDVHLAVSMDRERRTKREKLMKEVAPRSQIIKSFVIFIGLAAQKCFNLTTHLISEPVLKS